MTKVSFATLAILLPILAGCAQGGAGEPSAPADPLYACRMEGAAAADRYAGPTGNLDITSEAIGERAMRACLERARVGGAGRT